MSRALSRAAAAVAPLAPKEPRKATARDLLRVAEYQRLLEEGVDPFTATWRALSDERLGISRWRGAPASARPSDAALAKRIAGLLRRARPELLEQTHDSAILRIAGLWEKAVLTLEETASGNFEDAAKARVQLEAGKVVLEALGIGARAATANATTNVFVSLGDGLRALRGVTIEAQAAAPEPADDDDEEEPDGR